MTRKTLSNLLGLAGLLLVLALTYGDRVLNGHSMMVTVEGLRSDEGVLHVMVYDEAGAFDAASLTDMVGYASAPATGTAMTLTLRGMTPGTYAIALHHDENADDLFDMRGQTPLEGWAYSNNVGQTDTPPFEAAAFAFDGQSPPAPITLIYAN